MTVEQKVRIAMQLEALGVDVIEAGFPVISDGDFQAVRTVAERTESSRVCGLARCVEKTFWPFMRPCLRPGTGAHPPRSGDFPIHRQYKMNKSRAEILAMAVKASPWPRGCAGKCSFPRRTPPHGTRFSGGGGEAVIDAGTSIVNIPDTVGYTMPDEFHRLISYLKSNVPNVDRAVISVHCHDDMGMAVANSLAAIRAGARQVEGTINGIGERAGNTALEEVVMAVHSRPDFFSGLETGIRTRELVKTSRIVAEMSGMAVPRSKAVVGANAFSHGSGIHQDGILKNRSTYEIMDPEEIGWGPTELPLTKHSGRHAVKMRLDALGFSIPEEDMPRFFELFKQRGDRCKFVYDDDLSDMARSMLA